MLAILTTHPIQYQVPVWQELSRRGEVPFEVWYLSDHGHRHSFDRGFGRMFSWDIDMLSGYPCRFLPTFPRKANIHSFWGAQVGSLYSLIYKRRVTALLINGWYPGAYWQAAFQASRARIPVLLRAETNDLCRIPWWKERVKRPLLKLLFQRIAFFLAVGIANQRFYLSYGVPQTKIGCAPYCVDNKRFQDAAKGLRSQRLALRERWGIPQDGVCFLFSGKLVAKKRVQDVLHAFEILLVSHKQFDIKRPIHLLLVGDGPMREAWEEKASAMRKSSGTPCVTFAGFLNQTEMPKAYVVADCIVLPSNAEETWGLVVNEAMASGLPAIVSDQVGCGPDLIDPGITGDLFPTGDVRALAAAMTAWADLDRCGAARPMVQEKIGRYSIDRAVDGILEALGAVSQEPYSFRSS